MAGLMLTPVNAMTRERLTVLITNNILNNSIEFDSDTDMMDTDSPVRRPKGAIITKKLFHSPAADSPNNAALARSSSEERIRKAKKRRRTLIPDDNESLKRAYIRECDQDGPGQNGNIKIGKRVLVSIFHNKEYCMDCSG